VDLEQVPQATFADLRDARVGDPCAQCSGELEGARVIEIGNIFKLGTRYSEPLRATYLDENGKEQLYCILGVWATDGDGKPVFDDSGG